MPHFSFSQDQLADLAKNVLDIAKKKGASAYEVSISETVGHTVGTRLGEVESIEYHHDKRMDITVYVGQSKGEITTSDFAKKALEEAVSKAIVIARYTAQDPYAGLPDEALLAKTDPEVDLQQFYPWDLSIDASIAEAKACEAAGQALDAKIRNSEGAFVSTAATHGVYGNSFDLIKRAQNTRHSKSVSLIAQDKTGIQRDAWYSVARHPEDLASSDTIGITAAARALRRLNPRRLKTGAYPVLFEASLAPSLLGHWVAAISGGNLYRKASFLLDSLETPVFSPIVTIDEDPFLPRGLSSCLCDNEAVRVAPRTLLDSGVLKGYFLSSYSARKLGMQTTGNAGGPHNLLVRATDTFDALLKHLNKGVLITELLGQGVNLVTGDYSRGAAGFWVEKGEIQHPIEEITVAGNLREMLKQIIGIGDDVLKTSPYYTGSILIEKMTVASAA